MNDITNDYDRGIRKRRIFFAEEKLKIVEESYLPENSQCPVTRKYGIQPC
jgi:transposase-like protein